ncbi:NfeD family protein [Leptolyngbya sp. GGD]|uniref:NfeD family protein n=1 Tax=Leptolyngbya sp. GGD TaxID=2997907 RepID=UPI00227B6BA0|nr:NfeD family protein [Leptolyngbya sp. GGD]MCY6494564.1 NfeD family protein [Leptolyngbya sp. GGD]
MLKLIQKKDSVVKLFQGACVLDVSALREDERLEFKYDHHQNLVAIHKIHVSLLNVPQEAEAETDIEAGKIGRVFFEGKSWGARCEQDTKVLAGQPVLVTGWRDLLTVMVIPLV